AGRSCAPGGAWSGTCARSPARTAGTPTWRTAPPTGTPRARGATSSGGARTPRRRAPCSAAA
ncbi:MAG: hypothetical protein AVDCRST_MAG35-1002, partial [uncultured Quadrisphaera sp.]